MQAGGDFGKATGGVKKGGGGSVSPVVGMLQVMLTDGCVGAGGGGVEGSVLLPRNRKVG